MKVEIYSDIACPWCYIGKRRFERALAEYPGAAGVEVVYRPYQLDPGAAATARPLMQALGEKFGPGAAAMAGNVTTAARGEGITMDFERALAANTLAAHRLLRLAEQEYGAGAQHALAEALFAAHFTHGADIGDPEVLAGLAASAGMDPERVRAHLSSDEGLAEVREEIRAARQIGVTAVPTFVFEGKYGVQGAQPVAAFLQTLEAVEAQR